MIKAFSSLDKLVLNSPSEMRIKANVKNVEIQNVSYVKQVVGSTVKSIVTSSPSVVQATIKKDSDIGKGRVSVRLCCAICIFNAINNPSFKTAQMNSSYFSPPQSLKYRYVVSAEPRCVGRLIVQ